MMIRKSARCAVLACLMATAASAALALEMSSEIYVVASMGQSKIDESSMHDQYDALTRASVPRLSALSSRQTTEKRAFKLQLGHDFTPNLAVEGGYVDLGKTIYNYTYSYHVGSPIFIGPIGFAAQKGPLHAQRAAKIRGWNVDAVGKRRFTENLTGFARLGVIHAQVATEDAGDVAFGTSRNASSYKWRPHYGLGADYSLGGIFGVRAEYEKFSKVGDEKTSGSTDVDLVTVGVTARF